MVVGSSVGKGGMKEYGMMDEEWRLSKTRTAAVMMECNVREMCDDDANDRWGD
jgi:hypothetical protein